MSTPRTLTTALDFLRNRVAAAVLSGILVFGAVSAARAEVESYYVSPQAMRVSFQMGYGPKSPDRDFPVKTPIGKFTSGSGGFRFDLDTMTLTGLRLIINSGSLATPDRSFTWKLIGPEMFDVNGFEEIAVEGLQPVTFVNNMATIEGRLTVLGRPKSITLTAKLILAKDSTFLDKGKIIGLTLRGLMNCEDYNMKAFDNVGRSLGDQITLVFDMQGTRE